MTQASDNSPSGAQPIDGVLHRRSPLSVEDTVEKLSVAIEGGGARLFAVVDHSGEAKQAGLSLRDTKLMIFGNPIAGTPLMEAEPLAALDLPLKILVWADETEAVWMTYLAAEWLATRHGLPAVLAKPLGAPDLLTSRLAATD